MVGPKLLSLKYLHRHPNSYQPTFVQGYTDRIFLLKVLRCTLNVSVRSNVIPKYLGQKLWFILTPPNSTSSFFLSWLLLRWNAHTSIFTGFGFNRHSRKYVFMNSRSLFKNTLPSFSSLLWYAIAMSSANWNLTPSVFSMSCIYRLNKVGANIELWGSLNSLISICSLYCINILENLGLPEFLLKGLLDFGI